MNNKPFGYQEKKHGLPLIKRLGYLILFLCLATLLNMAATEYVAQQFGWPHWTPRNPFSWMLWAIQYPEYKDFFRQIWIGFLVVLAVMGGVISMIMYFAKKPQGNKTSAGTAAFAVREDIEQASLLTGDGVYVGGWEEKIGATKLNPLASAIQMHYLRHNGPEHILCFAPTRSGKGVGLVLPTLLSWQGSALVLDIKGELYSETAGWRSTQGGNISLLFDPARPESVGFNALEEVRIDAPVNGRFTTNGYEVSDAQNIALMLSNPNGDDISKDHFKQQAYSLITALIIHNRYKSAHTGEMASLADLGENLKDPDTLDIYAMFSK